MFAGFLATPLNRSVRSWRAPLNFGFFFFAIVSIASSAHCFGQTFWTDGNGNWNAASNWSLGVPNAGSGTAFDAVIENGGTAQLLGPPDGSVRRMRVGRAAGAGNVLVDAATLTDTQDLYLNENGTATSSMTVRNGSTVNAPTTSVGQSSSGGSIFTISDPFTSYNVGTQFIVGNAGVGVASLTVENGGLLNGGSGLIANASGTTGIATIEDSGSIWSTTSTLTVGNSGAGTLNIINNGEMYVGTALSIGNASTINLNGGTLRFATATGLNRLAYTSGTIQLSGSRNFKTDSAVASIYSASPVIPTGKGLTVEGDAQLYGVTATVSGGTLTMPNLLDIEDSGGTDGLLQVTNGGKVVSSGGSITDNGVATVSGAGSIWTTTGDLTITLLIRPGGDLNVVNQGTVYVGGRLDLGDTAHLSLNGGTLRFNGYGKSSSALLNYTAGTLQLAGDRTIGADAALNDFFGTSPIIPTGKALVIEGTATVTSTNPITLTGGSLTAGTLVLAPGARLTNTTSSIVSSPIVASSGSLIDTTAGDLAIGDSTKVDGFYCNGVLNVGVRTVTLSDANDAVFDSAAHATLGVGSNPGVLQAANGLTLDFGGNITGIGVITTPNNIARPLINNGHITGNNVAQPIELQGYVKGVGTFDNVKFTGTFSPGLSPTILTVGNVSLSPTSTLIMEIGGTTPGSGYDQIQSSGTLTFGGTLQISLINGFMPASTQSLDLFHGASTSGTFSTVQLPSLAGGLVWNTSQLYTSGVVSIVLPGDYNNNGVVDAADYVMWRKNQGTSNTLANDLMGGTIGQAQYNQWRTHFGQTAGSGSGAVMGAAVPEPTTLVQIILLAAVVSTCRRPIA